MDTKFYIQRGENSFGPYSLDQLRELANSQKILGSDLIGNSPQGPFQSVQNVLQKIQTGASQQMATDVATAQPQPQIDYYQQQIESGKRQTGYAKKKKTKKRGQPSRKKLWLMIGIFSSIPLLIFGALFVIPGMVQSATESNVEALLRKMNSVQWRSHFFGTDYKVGKDGYREQDSWYIKANKMYSKWPAKKQARFLVRMHTQGLKTYVLKADPFATQAGQEEYAFMILEQYKKGESLENLSRDIATALKYYDRWPDNVADDFLRRASTSGLHNEAVSIFLKHEIFNDSNAEIKREMQIPKKGTPAYDKYLKEQQKKQFVEEQIWVMNLLRRKKDGPPPLKASIEKAVKLVEKWDQVQIDKLVEIAEKDGLKDEAIWLVNEANGF